MPRELWRELREIERKADEFTQRVLQARRAVEAEVTRTGKCIMCKRRPPTRNGGYQVPVYCRPCDRILDIL